MELHKLAAVLLVSNEEFWLPFVLKSIMGKFPRFVIYDIGSEDKTRDVINWFVECEKERAELFVRYLPMIPREVQGICRNSMIAEACADNYMIIDGDEILGQDFSIDKVPLWKMTGNRIYGVCRRKELNYDLTMQYTDIRTHHRIYSRDAFWLGNHPGETTGITQNSKTEADMPDLLYFHFHNTLRSSTEHKALKRMERKTQATYHPGELKPFNLLEELPLLQQPVEHFPVSPVLRKLWDEQ
jgi:hypothetical protein